MPVYPKVEIKGRTYFQTEDPHVFIESMQGEGDARELIYVNFDARLRWKQLGDCHSCGIGDFDGVNEDGSARLPEGFQLQPGKKVGERDSVKDLNYDTRKDYPCTPIYPEQMKKNAEFLGVQYQCGLTFETLEWLQDSI